MSRPYGIAGRLAAAFIHSKLTPLVVLASLALGLLAVVALPREEEPQIIVPMIDVFVQMPGASPTEVEQRVTRPMEKLLWEVPGVEYVYSTSSPGMSMVIVRFRVGEQEEPALVRLNQKLASNFDIIPPGASMPLVKPRSIDDVPIMGADAVERPLRRLPAAADRRRSCTTRSRKSTDVSEVEIIGGRTRQVSVELDPARLASYGLDPSSVAARPPGRQRAAAGDRRRRAATRAGCVAGGLLAVERGRRASGVVVGSRQNSPGLRLATSPTVRDGDAEPSSYVTFVGTRRPRLPGRHAGDLQAQGHERDRDHAPRRRGRRAAARDA